MICITTEGGTRTLTLLPGPDFESGASANSATSASIYYTNSYVVLSVSLKKLCVHFASTLAYFFPFFAVKFIAIADNT